MIRNNFPSLAQAKVEKYAQKYGNSPKKFQFHLLLWALKQFLFRKNKTISFFQSDPDVIHIFFRLNGGIGDIVIALNYLQQFKQKFAEKTCIDLQVPRQFLKETQVLCRGQDFINKVICGHKHPVYDLTVTLIRIPQIEYADEKKIARLSPELSEWLAVVSRFAQNNPEYLRPGSVSDYLIGQYSLICGRQRIAQADIGNLLKIRSVFKIKPALDERTVLARYGLNRKKYITVQRGIGTADNMPNENSTRLWPLEHYNLLAAELQREYPQYQLVQLGVSRNLPIENTNLDLRGKTTFEEMLIILKHSALHIDGECGMMHLRHFLGQKPSVIIFGPTTADIFGYSENINLSGGACRGCEWLHNNWRNQCLKSARLPLCLSSVSPQKVITAIRGILK